MKIFNKERTPECWKTKVNFVDDNNRIVGFDSSQLCCEYWGWRINKSTEIDLLLMLDSKSEIPEDELERFSFVDEEPLSSSYTEQVGNDTGYNSRVRFRLNNGSEDAYLWLWNIHNGYYSHNFTYSLGENENYDTL